MVGRATEKSNVDDDNDDDDNNGKLAFYRYRASDHLTMAGSLSMWHTHTLQEACADRERRQLMTSPPPRMPGGGRGQDDPRHAAQEETTPQTDAQVHASIRVLCFSFSSE